MANLAEMARASTIIDPSLYDKYDVKERASRH